MLSSVKYSRPNRFKWFKWVLFFNASIIPFKPSSENRFYAKDNDLIPGLVPRYLETIFIDSSFNLMFVRSIS